MKILEIFNNNFRGKTVEIKRKLAVAKFTEPVTLRNTKVEIKEDDEGYDIIFSGGDGTIWFLDPQDDFIKIVK